MWRKGSLASLRRRRNRFCPVRATRMNGGGPRCLRQRASKAGFLTDSLVDVMLIRALVAEGFNDIDHDFARARSHRQGSEGMDHRPHIVVVEDEATQRRLLVDYLT